MATLETGVIRPQESVAEILRLIPAIPWYRDQSLRKLYAILIPACLFVAATNGYDGSMLNGLQALDTWKLTFHSPRGAILGLLSASYPLGAIISTPVSAFISDRFGRRWSVFFGSLIMVVGVAVQSASQNIGSFVAARIVLGFGVTIALTAAPILITELAHPRDRVTFTSLFNTTWYLGAVIAAWTTYGTFPMTSTWGWRIPSIIQGVPALLSLCMIMWLPESPRWLISKDRHEDALTVLANAHGAGDRENILVTAEMAEISDIIRIEAEAAREGISQLWATGANRKRLFIVICVGAFGQWSGNGLVSYYLAKILTSIGITAQKTQTRINGILTTVNYITSLAAAFGVSRIGRRPLFIFSTISMFLTFSALTTCLAVYNTHGDVGAANGALGFIFIYYTCFNIAFNPLLYLYPVEILPYRIRAMGISVLVFSNKASLFLNQFVNPIAMDAMGWKYYCVYIGWLVIEILVVYFVFPETKGFTLEEISELFEGKEAAAAQRTLGKEAMVSEVYEVEVAK
ncbi:general substrate transporter [Xylogone sp. PMI_703]|nr:general substrate transporter [Xylogone sp. PMI_703]